MSQKLKIFFGCVSGKKISQFPCQKEEVLLFMERVTEAQRIARVVMIFLFILFFNCFHFQQLMKIKSACANNWVGINVPQSMPCGLVYAKKHSKPPSVFIDMPRSLMHACTHYVRRKKNIYIYIIEKGFLKF